MNIFRVTGLLRRLHQCKHENRSFQDRLVVCFECGSTKRPDEEKWVAPWAWRDVKRARIGHE